MENKFTLYNGDCLEVMRDMEDNSVDSIVTDPPYELSDDGKHSPNRVFLELAFPQNAKVKAHGDGGNCLAMLIAEVLRLSSVGGVPCPAPPVPVITVALDNESPFGQHQVVHATESTVGVSGIGAIPHVETESPKHLGDFYLELADTTKAFQVLNELGACFDAGTIRVGGRLGTSGGPRFEHGSAPIVHGGDSVWGVDDALSHLVCASARATGAAVFSFNLGGRAEEVFSAHGAGMFCAFLQTVGAKLIRTRTAASGLPTMLQSRRVRVVNNVTDRAFTFNLVVHEQIIASVGFMGKAWDGSKVALDVAVWREALRVLKPGGHLLSFGGSRTYHRMACAVEDAGFEIRDQIMWVYGSGFPKSLNVGKAIDKAAGYNVTKNQLTRSGESTDAAKQWDGWGTTLKPAHEPIVVARKPLGTCATNVLQMVESQLRERGVRGEILWKPESASGAARSKKTTNSDSTRPLEPSGTSAKTADGRGTQSVEQQSPKSSERHGISGLNPTLGGSESFHGFTTSGCENPLSPPTAGSAPAAESVSVISSPSTTSTAEEHSTENKFTGRSTHNCAEKDSRLDTASFAGIATGLTGSMGTVHISRDSEGFFLWPKGLPEFAPGSPLTVAANVLAHGTGGLNIDGCRVAGEPWTRPGSNAVGGVYGDYKNDAARENTDGRWPANWLHDGSEEVLAGFPDSNGSAARFFYCAKASKKDRDEGLDGHETVIIEWSLTSESPKWGNADQQVVLQVDTEPSPPKVIAVSGASRKNAIEWSMLLFGNAHTAPSLKASTCIIEMPTSSTTGLTTLSYFQNLLTNENTQVANSEMVSGGSPAQTAAPGTLLLRTTGELMASALGVAPAASPMLLKISASERRSDHPTVKPTDLMAYLCRLVTPPGGVVLDPFMGSGSTGKAALREGFSFIGIEREEEYFNIANSRIENKSKTHIMEFEDDTHHEQN